MNKTLFLLVALIGTESALGAFVLPSLGGGGLTPMTGAPMKHAGIGFDGTAIEVHLDSEVATPQLRPLPVGDSYDPAKPWAVLSGKSHNAQHGWVLDGIWAPPAGLSVWVEELSRTPGLEVYEGGRYMNATVINQQSFAPIHGTDSSPAAWQWPGMMVHNAYAVQSPTEAAYEATYRVYLGDSVTGVEPTTAGVPTYGSDTVTFRFVGVPEPGSALLLAVGLFAPTLCLRR